MTAPEQIESTGISDSTSPERSGSRPLVAAMEARRSQVDVIDLAQNGDLSAVMLVCSPAELDGPSEQPSEDVAMGNLVDTRLNLGESDPSTQGPVETSISEAIAVDSTHIKRQAAAMATRYKGLTCPAWRRGGRCQFGSRCMFAHHDTGFDPPQESRINQDFTCYYWQNRLPCRHGYPCPHAHRNTGLYVGVDMKASTKHITCSFWRRHGCVWTTDACKYAHQDTGVYATGTQGHDRSVASTFRSNEEFENDRRFASSTSSRPRAVTVISQTMSTSALPTLNVKSQERTRTLQKSNEASYTSISKLTENVKVKVLSASAGYQMSSISGSWNPPSTTGSSSRLSPKSTTEDRVVMVHGVDTPFSPASSIDGRADHVIHGVDTPFSATSTVDTADRLPFSARNTLSTAPSSPARPGIESSPKPKTTRSSLLEHGTAESANGQAFFGYAPVLHARQVKHRQLSLDLEHPTTRQSMEQPRQISEKSRSSTPTLRDEKVVTAPVKHYAKRSAVDPRLLRRSALASARVKSAPSTDNPDSKTQAIKKCEKCSKRIMGSASLCTSCSRDFTWYSESIVPDGQRSEDDEPTLVDPRQLGPSAQESEQVGILLSNFTQNNAATSLLAAVKKHEPVSARIAEPTKALKRSNTDTPFISKKRPKTQIPTKIITRALDHRHESDSQVAALQGRFNSSLKSAETQKPEDLARLELLKQQNLEASSRQIQLVDFASTVEQVKVNEDRRASVAASPQIAEFPSLKHREASHEGQVSHTIGQNQETAIPRSQSREAVDPQMALQAHTGDAQRSRSRDSSVNHESLMRERTIPSSNKLGRKQRRCENCTGSHKRCLHYRSGDLDPALCHAFLQERKSFPKQQGSFSHEAQIAKIKIAARLYIPARSDDDISDVEDVENDDEKGHPDDDEAADDDDEEEADDNEEEEEPARSRSSDELLTRFIESSKQFLRSPDKLNEAYFHKPSAGQGMQETPTVQTSIPTPAQTPVPVVPVPESSTRQRSPERVRHRGVVAHPSSAQVNAMSILRKRGVQFDSDTDSDEDMEEPGPRSIVSSRALGLNSKPFSYDLFEVAPLLRPPVDPATVTRKPANSVPDLRAGVSKKQLWKELLQVQCAERRLKSGNPHKIVERDLPSRIVKTTVQQQGPIPEIEKAKGAMSLFVPHTEMKKVDMPFELFLRMPEEPVVVREKEVRKKGKVVEFELAFREGKNDRAQAVTLAGRKVRASGERWPFARG